MLLSLVERFFEAPPSDNTDIHSQALLNEQRFWIKAEASCEFNRLRDTALPARVVI